MNLPTHVGKKQGPLLVVVAVIAIGVQHLNVNAFKCIYNVNVVKHLFNV